MDIEYWSLKISVNLFHSDVVTICCWLQSLLLFHRCQVTTAGTERGYLEEGLSVTKMHELYNEAAEEGETVSLYIYDQVSNQH